MNTFMLLHRKCSKKEEKNLLDHHHDRRILFVVHSSIKMVELCRRAKRHPSNWFVTTTTKKIEFVTYATMSFFLYLSPDIKNFLLPSRFSINQSTKIWLEIVHNSRRVTAPSRVRSQSKDELNTLHLLNFHDKLSPHRQARLYIYPSWVAADPIHIYSCMYISREKKGGEREKKRKKARKKGFSRWTNSERERETG